jgi:hypothetical protein
MLASRLFNHVNKNADLTSKMQYIVSKTNNVTIISDFCTVRRTGHSTD